MVNCIDRIIESLFFTFGLAWLAGTKLVWLDSHRIGFTVFFTVGLAWSRTKIVWLHSHWFFYTVFHAELAWWQNNIGLSWFTLNWFHSFFTVGLAWSRPKLVWLHSTDFFDCISLIQNEIGLTWFKVIFLDFMFENLVSLELVNRTNCFHTKILSNCWLPTDMWEREKMSFTCFF